MGKTGRRKRGRNYRHANPLKGVDVRDQQVEIITRKLTPEDRTWMREQKLKKYGPWKPRD